MESWVSESTVCWISLLLSEKSYQLWLLDSSFSLLNSHLGATVSIQETEISIMEGTSGEICIVLENGELERNVSVTLTTAAGTAGV